MKKLPLFLSLVALFAFMTMAYGMVGTGAWFTDSQISNGMIITAGSLDLEVTGEPMSVANLEPDNPYADMGSFCAKNTGSTGLKFRGYFQGSQDSDEDLLKFMRMRVERQNGGEWVEVAEIEGQPDELLEGLPYYFQFPGQELRVGNKYIVTGTLQPEEETCYRFSVRLEPDTPNSLQDKLVEFVLYLYATQVTNTGW